MTYEQWEQELIELTAKETGFDERDIVINDEAAKEWYDDGVTPYFVFRENWRSESNLIP